MRQVKIDLPAEEVFDYLPFFHATLNCAAATILSFGGNLHKKRFSYQPSRWIYAAMGCSIVFLLSYVLYHFTTPETLYGDANKDGFLSDLEIEEVGFMRKVYLTILLSHISLQPSVFLLFYSLSSTGLLINSKNIASLLREFSQYGYMWRLQVQLYILCCSLIIRLF